MAANKHRMTRARVPGLCPDVLKVARGARQLPKKGMHKKHDPTASHMHQCCQTRGCVLRLCASTEKQDSIAGLTSFCRSEVVACSSAPNGSDSSDNSSFTVLKVMLQGFDAIQG